MKSVKSEKSQAEWLVQQIKQLDQMIEMHQNGGSHFMVEQYQQRRMAFFQELISLLAVSKLSSPQHRTFPLIAALIRENYPRRSRMVTSPKKAKTLEKVASLYLKT
ncbi:MAG: hypothetical protein ACK4Q5_20605 [Saprospiraceae bacterium]